MTDSVNPILYAVETTFKLDNKQKLSVYTRDGKLYLIRKNIHDQMIFFNNDDYSNYEKDKEGILLTENIFASWNIVYIEKYPNIRLLGNIKDIPQKF